MTYDESFRKDDEDTTPLHMLNAFFVCLKIHPKNHKVKTVNKSHKLSRLSFNNFLFGKLVSFCNFLFFYRPIQFQSYL